MKTHGGWVWHLRQTGAHVCKDRQGLLAARRGWKTQKPLLLSILLWPCVCHTPSVLYCMPKNCCFESPKGGTYQGSFKRKITNSSLPHPLLPLFPFSSSLSHTHLGICNIKHDIYFPPTVNSFCVQGNGPSFSNHNDWGGESVRFLENGKEHKYSLRFLGEYHIKSSVSTPNHMNSLTMLSHACQSKAYPAANHLAINLIASVLLGLHRRVEEEFTTDFQKY